MNPYFKTMSLFGTSKISEKDDKYKFIHEYMYFRSLEESVRDNHKKLLLDFDTLGNINLSSNFVLVFTIKYRLQNSILNLLNSHKIFLDFIDRRYKTDNGKFFKRFGKIKSYYYDNNFDYRFLEVIRNYCQHARTLPLDIHADLEGRSYLFVDKAELKKDKQAYGKIKAELDGSNFIELKSVIREWIEVADHIYGLVLDYFAYMAKPNLDDYMVNISRVINRGKFSEDEEEILKKCKVFVVNKIMYFPVGVDTIFLCEEICKRLDGGDHKKRYLDARDIFLSIRSMSNTNRKFKLIGVDVDKLKFDTLTNKNMNKFMRSEDLF
ncbi:hypothetical protein OX459_08475 [Janthinobacterium sp. SUN026]|uniref:hypothetical protein n=1 Tax=Janthinobacterium sp. SUN026 TaxID=3002438 RepID=UPI0025B24B05|nr:hypothetical protein [Janthinobacterium sp. SUN026]MDN2671422.1 hypothetical protein [Janthinobacterium sp. SUN026]